MCPNHNLPKRPVGRRRRTPRRGLTLVELLMATLILGIVAAALSGLAAASRTAWEYGEGYGNATQHARVVLDRIARTVGEATATETYPGVVVAYATESAWQFPENLVVWRPQGAPANPQGPPLVGELVIFGPDPNDPTRLMEFRRPNDSTPAPWFDGSDPNLLLAAINAIKGSSQTQKTLLTDLVRAPQGPSVRRAAIRFVVELRPSAAQWDEFLNGERSWEHQLGPCLFWPQSIYGSTSGLRQVWVRMELQLMPSRDAAANVTHAEQAIPFFGSAALYYQMDR